MNNQPREIRWEVDDRGCWNCTSHHCNSKRYPLIRCGRGKRVAISRVVYAEKDPTLRDDEVVRHSCDNRRCINPAHLLKGTTLDNMRDKVERNRQARGTRCPWAKLDESKVRDIRSRYRFRKVTYAMLAAECGISVTHAIQVIKGEKWAWVR